MLEVPESLNRNDASVRAMGDPADTGLMLINYMCERIGIETLAGLDVLDFGCGVRFSQAIINRSVPVGSYAGVDVNKTVVDFLKANVTDARLSYHHINMGNRYYHPNGAPLHPDLPTPLGDAKVDLVCMFSVITHQQPDEAMQVFSLLRRHVKPAGRLFFSAFIHQGEVEYEERDPQNPGLMSSYSLAHMTRLLGATHWSIISVADPWPNGVPIQTSFLCGPFSLASPRGPVTLRRHR